jgi:LPS-assembly protein
MFRNVEVTRGATGITADTACYRQVEDEVTAQGHITMWRFGDRYKGDALQLNLETGKGWVLNPAYHLQMNNGQGKAARIDFLGENQAQVVDGTYSTCEGPDPDWYLKSSTLNLDSGRDVGTAGKTVIYFKDVPILGTPALSFSLSGARRSGWLPPSIGTGSKGAAEIMVPYYVNIAPNRDLTLYPRYIFNRGLQMGATGRYMGETSQGPYSGETHLEVLPNDRVAKRDRWWVDTLHSQVAGAGLELWLERARRVRQRIPVRLFAHRGGQRRAPAAARAAHRLLWPLLEPERARPELPGAAGSGLAGSEQPERRPADGGASLRPPAAD